MGNRVAVLPLVLSEHLVGHAPKLQIRLWNHKVPKQFVPLGLRLPKARHCRHLDLFVNARTVSSKHVGDTPLQPKGAKTVRCFKLPPEIGSMMKRVMGTKCNKLDMTK